VRIGQAIAALLSLLAAAGSAAAAERKPLWELGLGAGGLRLPAYRGSDHSRNWLLPVPYAVYRGDILRADRKGARALLFEHERVEFDLSLSASAPAKSSDDPARDGMPDLAATVEIGPKLDAVLARGGDWKLDLALPLRAVVTVQSHLRAIGWSATPVINLDARVAGANLGVQAGPLWGDRRLHAYFYDVAPQYATATRPEYHAHAGYAGWQSTVALSRRSGRLWAGAYLRLDSVAGAAFESSPLVTSRRQWSGGLALAWVFATSDTLVSVDE
jgi:MipA family protein